MSIFNKELIKNLHEKEYKFKSYLGKGSFGKIENWEFNNKNYAIKEFSDKKNIARNIKVINFINKNIKNFKYILFYNVEIYNNNYYLKSKICSFDFFNYFIIYNNLLSLEELLYIIYQLFIGINQLHNIGIIHGDLKMENIFLPMCTT